MSKFLQVKMQNGETYLIPAEIVANNRADYYAQRENMDTSYVF
jgi:hypothetical protein